MKKELLRGVPLGRRSAELLSAEVNVTQLSEIALIVKAIEALR